MPRYAARGAELCGVQNRRAPHAFRLRRHGDPHRQQTCLSVRRGAEKRQEWGIHTVVVNSRQGGCPLCAKYVGKVFIDDVYSGGTKADGGYPLLSEAIKGGLFHPRCKDSTSTYFERITTLKPVTEEEMAEMARREKLEARESYCKNEAKKNRRIAEHSLDPDNKRTYAHRADVFEKKAAEVEKSLKILKKML